MRFIDEEGLYAATEDGKILSFIKRPSRWGKRLEEPVVLAGYKTGYKRRYIGVNVCGKKQLVHRIIASVFIPNPLGLPEVNHKDGNPENNDASNLEWISSKDNSMHACYVLGRTYAKPKKIVACNSDGNEFNFRSICDAIRFVGKDPKKTGGTKIRLCCQGKRKTAYGFSWRYSDGDCQRHEDNFLV